MKNKKEKERKEIIVLQIAISKIYRIFASKLLQTFTGVMLKLEMLCSSRVFLHSAFNPDAISWRQICEGGYE